MLLVNRRKYVLSTLLSFFATAAWAQQTPVFTSGNLVVLTEGCGVQGGFCANVPYASGANGSYADNQAAPITLLQFAPNGTSSLTYVNSLVLPQAASGTNFPVSGEYGSSSEGGLHLSGNGQYLTFGAYGLNAAAFNASPATYGAMNTAAGKYNAFAQTGSLTGQSYTPVARVVALIDPYGNVNSSTAVYNIYNLNNPRSAFTTGTGGTVYMSGQGTDTDATAGVFSVPLFGITTSPTAITGLDTGSGSTTNVYSQDTRDVQIYNNTLYVSVDSKGGSNAARSFLGTLGTPPATSVYNSQNGPTQIAEYSNASTPVLLSKKGQLTLTTSEANNISASGASVYTSPSGYYFANLFTLYIADTGASKQGGLGIGGLQKWVNTNTSGTGNWIFQYTLSAGLNLVANTASAGATGLYAVTGTVSGANVYLYATNYNINDIDPTYIYGFTDVLTSTAKPTGTAASFTQLATAPAGSNFKGIAFAPTLATGSTSSVTITTVPSGVAFTSGGTGCAAGSYVSPVTLNWTAGSACTLTMPSTTTSKGEMVTFANWQDGTTATTYNVTAPSTPTVYRANFSGTGFTGLQVSGLGNRNQLGVQQNVTVTAVDASGNAIPGFTGTVFFTSSDPSATLPSSYTFQASDAGTHPFNVTLNTAGSDTVTVTSGSVSVTTNVLIILTNVWLLNGNDAAVKFTSTTMPTTTVGGASGTSTAGGVAFDSAGNVWVTQADTSSVNKYSTSGSSLGTGTGGGLSTPVALAVDGAGSIWIANAGNNSVSVFSNSGAAVSASGYTGGNNATAGYFNVPSALAIDNTGGVWVTNKTGNSVSHVIGAAAPVVAPLSSGTANATLGTKP